MTLWLSSSAPWLSSSSARDRFWRIGSPAAARGSSGIALAYGLTIAVMVSALGHVSGGHFDPAVTLGALVARKISVPDAAVHWISRLAGGVVGGAAPDRRLRSRHPAGRRPRDAGARCRLTVGQRLTFEIVATFFLVLVVCATAIDSRGVFSVVSGLPIGLVITFDILAGGPVIAR